VILRTQPRLTILFAVMLLALVALACGEYPGVPRQFAGYSGDGSDLPPVGGSAADNSASGSQVVMSGNAVEIELRDFEIFPSDLTVSAGEITFTLVNAGRFTHDFRIEGEGLDEKSPRISAGRTDEWAVALAPGVYQITCPISNHSDRGMIGTLTVTP
jgi:uncharacterized cupredoxin-like copper-binding protein